MRGRRQAKRKTRCDSTSIASAKHISPNIKTTGALTPIICARSFLVCNLMTFLFSFFFNLPPRSSRFINSTSMGPAQTSVADFIIESIYDLQGKVNDERVTSPIRNLRKRFDDVCSWTTYIVLSQLLPDERRAAFGCLLRVAITCWNIGNFIGAKEIITGLR